jgi:ABC-2 type transporter
MSTATEIATLPRRGIAFPGLAPLVTLARRRFQLTVRTPRELVVPLVTPILFALVIAPALKHALHTSAGYESLVAVGTVGLLIPLNTMFSGLSVIGDREQGAQRELLAAPIRRPLLLLGNLVVALAITGFQVVTLLAFALARGIDFNATGSGIVWFVAAALLFAVGMYGVAETLGQPRAQTRRVHLPRPRHRDRAVVPRRVALSHQRAPRVAHMDHEVPAAHPRPRGHALRAAGRRERAPQHLGRA